MAEIYSHCSFVVVWLDSVGYHPFRNHSSMITAENFLRDKYSVCTMLQNKYFLRLWVVQEVLLASEVRPLLQNIWIKWDDLRRVAEEYNGNLRASIIPRSALALLRMRHDRSYSMEKCIETFSGQDCEDPRDRVYGLMGLVNQEERVAIDYAKSVYEVYSDLVVAFSFSYTAHTNRSVQSLVPRRSQFSTKLQDYVLSLVLLSERMGFSMREVVVLRSLLQDVWCLDKFSTSNCPPITAIGFEETILQDTTEAVTSLDSTMRGRWWYTYRGRTYYYEC
ncbi:hypothetical protein GQ44DRAFT_713212 [Phaeosphaeriaceae sp. PMI808]|nr:hypothetical protein GQ44DRAFT_713212 [Phaeosphaeriaceae sp. PMI808]